MLSFERARRERSPAQQRHVRLVLEGLKADGWTNIGGGSHDRFVNESQPGEHGRCSPPPRNVARRGAIDRQGGWLDMSQRSGALIYYAGVLDGAGSVWACESRISRAASAGAQPRKRRTPTSPRRFGTSPRTSATGASTYPAPRL